MQYLTKHEGGGQVVSLTVQLVRQPTCSVQPSQKRTVCTFCCEKSAVREAENFRDKLGSDREVFGSMTVCPSKEPTQSKHATVSLPSCVSRDVTMLAHGLNFTNSNDINAALHRAVFRLDPISQLPLLYDEKESEGYVVDLFSV